MEMQAEAEPHQTCGELAEVKKTSRAKSIWHEEEQQDCDIVEQPSSVQDPGAHAQPKQKRTREQAKDSENLRSERLYKSEAEVVDVMDTFQHVISIIEKEMAKNLAFLQKEIGTRKHEQRHGSAHHVSVNEA